MLNRYQIPFYVQAPLLRMLFPFIVGIILAYYFSVPTKLVIVGFVFFILLLLRYPTKFLRRVFGALAFAVFLFLGIAIEKANDASLQENFVLANYQPGDTVLAALIDPPIEKAKTFQVLCRLWKLKGNSQIALSGTASLYVEKENFHLDYGEAFVFTNKLQQLKNSGNPGGFAYADYAAQQNIYLQGFLKKADYKILAKSYANPLLKSIYRFRNYTLDVIKTYVAPQREKGLAEALLIGYRADLDRDLTEQYVNTGTVHIIAISGMHLGMLYGILLFLFKPLMRTRYNFIAAAVILLIVWAFVFATGAAPSITRAGIMFTLMLGGRFLHRKTSSVNALAAAAFIILLIDPLAVFNVGFQLSFSAVLGIILFYPVLNMWLISSNNLLNKLWSLIAVTISAQILTLPLAVYHFHQFPLNFLIANLIAVPLSGLALYLLVALLAFSWWPWAAALLGKCISVSLWLLNYCVLMLSKMRGFLISQIQWDIPLVLLVFILIIAISIAWQKKSIEAWVGAGICLLAAFSWHSVSQQKSTTQQQLIVYHVPGNAAIDVVEKNKSLFIGDSVLAIAGFQQNFHLLPTRIYMQFNPSNNLLYGAGSNYQFHYGNKNILVLRSPISYNKSQKVIADLLLISANVAGNPSRILEHISTKKIVLDGTNSVYHQQRWKNVADSLNIPLHNTATDGALIVKL